MRLFLRTLIVILIVCGVSAYRQPAHALSGACAHYSSYSGTYDNGQDNGDSDPGYAIGETITVHAELGTATSATIELNDISLQRPIGPSAVPSSLTFTFDGGFRSGVFFVTSNGTVNITASCSDGSSASLPVGSVTSFVPDDPPGQQRVAPLPGDRTASYCNDDDLVVYGVQPNSKGFLLGQFSYNDLLAAGLDGLTKSTGDGGTVSASMDSSGNIYVAWNGGSFGANGQGDFAKSFHCSQGVD